MNNKFLPIMALLFLLSVVGKPQHVKFEYLNISQGLSNASVRSIFQDRQGFVWFGTLNGLNRFDGRNIRVYNYNAANDKTISNNRISQIYQDESGYIWILTYDNKVHRFDTKNNSFKNLPFDVYAQHKLLAHSFIQETSPGVLWILLSNGGCGRITVSGHTVPMRIDIFNPDNLFTGKEIQFILSDINRNVWLGTSRGLYRLPNDTVSFSGDFYDRYYDNHHFSAACETGNIIIFGTERDGIFLHNTTNGAFSAPPGNDLLKRSRITCIEKNGDNQVLIGTINNGLALYEPRANELELFDSKQGNLKSLMTEGIYPDSYNKFWIATDNRGITFFDPENHTFRHFGLNESFRESNYEGEKHVIFEDSNNSLWIGIHGGGLFCLHRSEMEFEHFCYDDQISGSLSSNYILSVFEDRSRNLWVGTRAGGLNKLNMENQPFFRIQPFKEPLPDRINEIRAFCQDRHGNIWVGTKTGDLLCYTSDMNPVTGYSPVYRKLKSVIGSGIYVIYSDKAGNLWIGTKGEGIYVLKNNNAAKARYDVNKTEIVRFRNIPGNDNSLISDNVYSILEDTLHRIWIGTYQGGISMLENPWTVPRFRHFRGNETNYNSLSDSRVRQLYFDSEQSLWIGTVNGLNYLPSAQVYGEKKRFIRIMNQPGNEQGLSYNDVLCIYEDSYKNMWIGTFGGGLNMLESRHRADTAFEWHHYFDAENYSKNVIYSILEDNNKNIWLSTDYGLRKISGGSEFEDFTIEETIITGFYSEGGALKTRNDGFLYGHKNGMLHFFPDSVKRTSNDYPVVITGFTIHGQPAESNISHFEPVKLKHDQNFLTISFAVLDFTKPDNIQYAYILENYESRWNFVLNHATATYKNLKPGRYNFRVKGTNSYGRWNPFETELEIIILKPFYFTRLAYAVYALIIFSILFIIVRLWLNDFKLRHKINMEEKLTENKLKFYTSISHELKTPLTLILGITEKLVTEKQNRENTETLLGLIKRNSLKLLNLIDQLLDFRKIQKDKMDLNVRPTEIVSFVRNIYTLFVPLSLRKQIDFSFKSNEEAYTGWVDNDFLEKIIFNLLSNAFKYTPAGNPVTLNLDMNNEKQLLTLTVADKGKGIAEKDLPRIFERFNRLPSRENSGDDSSGIGLSLTKELVEIHRGSISVLSGVNEGTTFTVTIPVDRAVYRPDEIVETGAVSNYLYYTEKNIGILDETFEYKNPEKGDFEKNYALLVIEDNAELRSFITGSLSSKYIIHEAEDGKTALNLAIGNMPDLIVCDLMIPEIDGIELCRQLKNNYSTSHIPVIMLTAVTSADQKIKSMESGADDYITKPFSMEYLEKRIDNIILQRKRLKEKFSKDPGMLPEKLCISQNDQKLLENIIQIIEKNISQPDYSIDKVASQVGLGRTMFYKKIKALTGCTPHDFIKIIRMKTAANLLTKGKSVTTVSYEVGFMDVEYFSKNFKKYFGLTPSEYQKNESLQV